MSNIAIRADEWGERVEQLLSVIVSEAWQSQEIASGLTPLAMTEGVSKQSHGEIVAKEDQDLVILF